MRGYLLGRPAKSAADRRRAASRYTRLVASVPDTSLWDSALRQQIYLGDEDFVERIQALAAPRNSTHHDIPRAQRRKSRTLAQWLASCANREEALYRPHTESALSISAIAREVGLSVLRVSRLIARAEEAKGKACLHACPKKARPVPTPVPGPSPGARGGGRVGHRRAPPLSPLPAGAVAGGGHPHAPAAADPVPRPSAGA